MAQALSAGGLVAGPDRLFAQELSPTPACHDGDSPTLPEIEGPFYKPRTPERADLSEDNSKGRAAEITGYVLDRACRPIARALLDLWHADETGEYDERGFRYRGHVLTDAQGRYRFRTIMPGLYPGRTRHYHMKVAVFGQRILTTQLYFPNEPFNVRDDFFHRELLMQVADAGTGIAARFDFVIATR
jgi:protocatechuate 3,4-dioxygenase beta subunit